MAGVAVHVLDEGSVGVRIDWRNLPDLDALMLDVWAEALDAGASYACDGAYDDEPTRFAHPGEAEWQWAKMSPCPGDCEEHSWHWDGRSAERWPRHYTDPGLVDVATGDPDLIEDRPRGRFVALYWGH